MASPLSSAPPAAAKLVPAPALAGSYTAGGLPTELSSWPLLGRTLLRLLLASLGIAMLVNPSALRSAERFALTYAFTFAYTAGLWLTNGLSVDWLNARVPWTRQPLRRLLLTLLISLLGSVLVIVGVNALFWLFYFRRPLPELFEGRQDQILVPLAITVVISLTTHARSFLLGWRAAAVRAEQLEKETAVARLDSLRRQVDPHFLFNSLNALTSLVEENDPARAVGFIQQLSQVYRYVLDSQSHELVPLAEELRFTEAYLFLQKTRLGEALVVETAWPTAAEAAPFFVPPLAVQLLVENALKHNTAFQADPLRLRLTLDAAARTLSVRNTLRPRRLAAGEASGQGLKNLTARYAFLTDRPLKIGPTGAEFVAVLPLLTMSSYQ